MKQSLFFSPNDIISAKKISVIKNKDILNQSISIPSSKSITNRALVLCGMCSHPVTLQNFLFSEDSYWGLLALQNLGFQIEINYNSKEVSILPPSSLHQTFAKKIVFLGKAGTLARFFPAVILNWQNTFTNSSPLIVTLDGETQLQNRPLTPLIKAFQTLGGKISSDSLPITIESSQLKGECHIDGNISGQFLSGLLLAGSTSRNNIQIHREKNLVQPNYIKITLKMIEEFGGKILADETLTKFEISPTPKLFKENYNIEADASTACYFICLSYLHNFNLHINNLGSSTLQPDFNLVYLLQEIGVNIIINEHNITLLKQESSQQKNSPSKIDCSLYSDQALTIGILALFLHEPIEVYGVSHIRQHESNRILGLITNLTALGIKAIETNDGFIVHPLKKNLHEVEGIWETYEDHRFVMAGFLLASLCPNVKISNPRAVEKTAPNFFELTKFLGFNINYHQ